MSEPVNVENALLVDDDNFIQDIYKTKFSEAGIDVTVAENGSAALESLRENDFDVVLVDLIMPEMGGLDLLEAVRSEGCAESSIVIVLSNQGQPDDIDKAEEFGIDGYIVKSNYVPSEVLSQVTEIYEENYG